MAPEEGIRQATVEDLDTLVPLFDAYRQFYRQPSDMEGARRFLLARFENNQSVIFIAFRNGTATGFVQLYPSFSSTAMARILVLNDLFVAADARRQGWGGGFTPKSRRIRESCRCLAPEFANRVIERYRAKTLRISGLEARSGVLRL